MDRIEATIPPSPAITWQTSLVDDEDFLRQMLQFLHMRVHFLRSSGYAVNNDFDYDFAGLLGPCMKPPRGLETGKSVLKRALPEAERNIRRDLVHVHAMERFHMYNHLRQVEDIAKECVAREEAPDFANTIQDLVDMQNLRQRLREELNPDAVWLREDLSKVQALETKHGDWVPALIAKHETQACHVLLEAVRLGVEVGPRQTVMPEYCIWTVVERAEAREVQRLVELSGRQTWLTEYFTWV